jgi:hypothetical protein
VSSRLATALFVVVCAGGSTSALALAVHEARTTDPVVARVVSTSRAGATTTARVTVRNTRAEPRCVRLRVVARDRAGHDLGSSRLTVVRLAGKGKADVRADFTLTDREYDERLSSVRPGLHPCS